jgi:electron transport complex protein RnfG
VDEFIVVTGGEGEPVGFAVIVSPPGFAGPIQMLVGVSPYLEVTGVHILRMRETAGIGTRIDEHSFLGLFAGRIYPIYMGTEDNEIDTLSGATVSARAVVYGVNSALKYAETVLNTMSGGEPVE